MPVTPIPIFLFSLPRAGSTFVQRILASHKEITTTSEPWILLPYLYTLKRNYVHAEYEHNYLTMALEDFYSEFPQGKKDYLAEMHDFILRLYAKANKNNTRYFLDKTPRYCLITEDIINLFPEAKFIFLWRNPLAIIASAIETWGSGKWNITAYKVDLYTGLNNLIEAYKKNKDTVLAIRYEDILTNPEAEFQRIHEYLGLSFDPEILSIFNETKLKGRMGDPTGTKKYHLVSKDPLEKWKHTLSNPFRKIWCRRYLWWIGRERFAVMGYNFDNLLSELNAIPYTYQFIVSDILINSSEFASRMMEYIKHRLELLTHWYRGRKNKNLEPRPNKSEV